MVPAGGKRHLDLAVVPHRVGKLEAKFAVAIKGKAPLKHIFTGQVCDACLCLYTSLSTSLCFVRFLPFYICVCWM